MEMKWWILLIALAVVAVPIKLRILRNWQERRKEQEEEKEDF
ncbi:MAG: hypothetical protein K0R93_2465 [Anaerosolibacter sp.]|jgi:hypothetical protein|nr:hypothetical protein [Anaerosolibacter sp.]MDF2547567.1 hypothetical protein [Anaerosolibacter sp.]